MFPSTRAARDGGAAGPAGSKNDYGFNSWITAGIDDLAAVDSDDLGHRHNKCSPFEVLVQHIEHWCERQASEILIHRRPRDEYIAPKSYRYVARVMRNSGQLQASQVNTPKSDEC